MTVAISPDCQLVAAGSMDGSVRVWNMQGDSIGSLEDLHRHKASVYSVAFSPNSEQLISGSLDKTIKMWEINSSGHGEITRLLGAGRCLKTFEGHRVSFYLFAVYSNN